MSEFQQIALGDRVVDPISGFKGIAHCVTIWLNGCIRIGIAPEGLDKDGKVQDDRYFDQGQLRILDKGVHKPVRFVLAEAPVTPTTAAQRTSGGPARETSNFRPLSTPTR